MRSDKARAYAKAAVAGLVLLAVFGLLSTREASRAPHLLGGAQVDETVRAILDRSCADCHSDQTYYPWYSFLPMVSGTIEEDIRRGREQLNLSHWQEYSRLRRQRALTGIANQVRDRAMPLPNYLWLHPSAKLSEAEVDAVFDWAQKERLRLILER